MTTTATPDAKITSLETLAQADLEAGLKRVERAETYIERLFAAVPDDGEEYGEVRALALATRKAVESLQSVESALFHAVKDGDPIDFRP